MTKGVMFDKDGTLFEFGSIWSKAIEEFLVVVLANTKNPSRVSEALGVHNGLVQSDSVLSSGTIKDIGDMLVVTHVYDDEALAEQFVKKFFLDFLKNNLDLLTPIGDLVALMQRLHDEEIKVGIVTSDDLAPTELSLEYAGIAHLVDFIASGDHYPRKPDPTALHAFCEKFNLTPTDVLIVGDSRMDLELGSQAKAGVAVLSGVGDATNFEDLTKYIYPSIQEIPYLEILK